ncbi:MAG: SOS response-associated peptidase [Cyclobacteriaceae bacterium]|nr:SOS response-associated peptidase [Cyclobacteriaceae bacterium]
MCYDISYLTKRQTDYAKRYGSKEDVEDIKKRFPPVYHTNGFMHPPVPVVTGERPDLMQMYTWGLIPNWSKSWEEAEKIRSGTINARGESLWNKPAFRQSAKERRCLVIVDGFFEYHHHQGRTFPYYFKRKDDQPMALGGIWDRWENGENGMVLYTFSIVTTAANERMTVVHNNPKVLKRGGPRMPLIVPEESEKDWISDQENVIDMIRPYPVNMLTDYTVHRLKGPEAMGNVPQALELFEYPELKRGVQGKLF